MFAQTQTASTGASRRSQATQTTMNNARAFLAKTQVDDDLAAKLADADGDMPSILALAAGESLACSARELVAAYEELLRSGPAATTGGASAAQDPALRAPSDLGHPAVYTTLGAPSDLGHPVVYLTLGAPSDLGYPIVYIPRATA